MENNKTLIFKIIYRETKGLYFGFVGGHITVERLILYWEEIDFIIVWHKRNHHNKNVILKVILIDIFI